MIDTNTLIALEKTSMLSLTDLQRNDVLAHLNACLAQAETHLSAIHIDIANDSLCVNTLTVGNVLRKDEVVQTFTLDDVQADAPESRDGYFVVPKV